MRRRLNKFERSDLSEVNRIAQTFLFVANYISGNTALVPGGQKVAKQYKAIADLLENVKKSMISQKLTQLGYPQGVDFSVNLKTGRIKKPSLWQRRSDQNVAPPGSPQSAGQPAGSPNTESIKPK